MQYLKPRQEYVDRYDRNTVEKCRWAEKAITPDSIKEHSKEKVEEAEQLRMSTAFNNLHVWMVAGEMYSRKEETISEWMRKDEERDRFQEHAKAPQGINCLTCSREMFVTHKHLETRLDKSDRMLFMYDCTLGHMPRRAFYDNGEEFKRDKPKCPKCQTAFEEEDKTTDEKFITVSTCPSCGHEEVSEIERTANKEVVDPDYEKDRARFCSEKTGQEYVNWISLSKEIGAMLDKHKDKENNKELYDEVAKIKRLKIIELEQLLAPALEAENFVRLHFKDPEITRDVVVLFTIHDAKEGREERSSCLDLQRLIKKVLEGTNWRLMSDGASYRLGMLEGRLRAYEKEEDLAKLLQAK